MNTTYTCDLHPAPEVGCESCDDLEARARRARFEADERDFWEYEARVENEPVPQWLLDCVQPSEHPFIRKQAG